MKARACFLVPILLFVAIVLYSGNAFAHGNFVGIQSAFVDSMFALQVIIPRNNIRLSEASFDKSSFGQLTLIAARKKSEDSLQAHLVLIEKATVLREAQRSKLELAGQIDIHRFFAEYESVKRSMKFGILSRNDWQARLAGMRERTRPFKNRYARGLHDESSLLAKTTTATLDEDQKARIDRFFKERSRSNYANSIRITLAMIDRRVPLTQKQRSTMTTLLLSKSAPLETGGSSSMQLHSVLNQMAEIENEIRELFSDQEWDAISRLILFGKTAVKP